MRPLFVDTSGWYDMLAADSPDHEALVRLMREPGRRLVTTTYVLDELTAFLVVRSGHATAARVGTHIRSAAEVEVEHPDAAEEAQAWSLFLGRPDKTYTLTDCLSFTTMRRLGIDTAIAADEHFRQEGFITLP